MHPYFCRQLEAKAAEKARQIEGHTPNNRYIELENGDEEEAFSAVHRGDSRGKFTNQVNEKLFGITNIWHFRR